MPDQKTIDLIGYVHTSNKSKMYEKNKELEAQAQSVRDIVFFLNGLLVLSMIVNFQSQSNTAPLPNLSINLIFKDLIFFAMFLLIVVD